MPCGKNCKTPSHVVKGCKYGDPMMNNRKDDREPFHLNRPDYNTIRDALEQSLLETLTSDWDLIALGCHEQSIAHRLAVYLERRFPKFHTDCEYNRRKHFVKDYPAESGRVRRAMRPDIIVHRRNSVENVLAVEMKANANNSTSSDPQKLQALHSDADYLYKATAFIRILNSITDIQHGVLRADIVWYDVSESGLKERKKERTVVRFNDKKDQVREIYDSRRNARRNRP